MAKKTKKRRLNSRLMRTVRKTSAAVLMILALLVAAIPAENLKATGTGGVSDVGDSSQSQTLTGKLFTDTRKPYTYEIVDDRTDGVTIGSGENARVEYDSISNPSKNGFYQSVNVDLSAHHRHNTAVGACNCDKSYTVWYSSNKKFILDWQFKYKGDTLYEYNHKFAVENLTVPFMLYKQYYVVPVETVNDFYKDGSGDKKGEKVYSYDFLTWYEKQGQITTNDVNGNVLQEYFFGEWAAFVKKCEESLKSYEEDLAYYKAHKDDEGFSDTKPQYTDPKYQVELSVMPKQLQNTADKWRYFCDYNTEPIEIPENFRIPGEPDTFEPLNTLGTKGTFTLQEAIDATGASSADENSAGNKSIYLVKVLKPDQVSGFEFIDENNFLVHKAPKANLTNIGDYAFAGVTNVDNLILPQEITNIGDYAFADSFLKSIDLANVEVIGNGSFKRCPDLVNINLSTTNIKQIGAEAFYGTGIESITFPSTLNKIHPGAFAYCKKLKSVDFTKINNKVEVGEASFYDCSALETLNFDAGNHDMVKSLGKACFGVVRGDDKATELKLPLYLANVPSHLFSGRAHLKTVVLPMCVEEIDPEAFYKCYNLEQVIFPTTEMGYDMTASAEVPELLFADVTNKNLVVYGPGYIGGQVAPSRSSTWKCFSMVNDFVPYRYIYEGLEYYEVCDGNYILNANENGELVSCEPLKKITKPFDLVIPSKVGQYAITSIRDGAFSNQNLRQFIQKIIISDNTLTNIPAGVFKELPNLQEVVLGNSVTTIGDEAFLDCRLLEEVTFRNQDNVSLGKDAFKTRGSRLIFHGAIREDYGPFVWAMQPDNYVNDKRVRVCYKQIEPSCLTVILNDAINEHNPDGNNPLPTLVDYPKFDQLDRVYKEYAIEDIYDEYSVEKYNEKRDAFYKRWKEACEIKDSVDRLKEQEKIYKNEELSEDDAIYGPWINELFCIQINSYVLSTDTQAFSQSEQYSVWKQLQDTLWKPLVVSAEETKQLDIPSPYFEKYDYSIEDKINKINEGDTANLKEWERELTNNEAKWLDACKNIVVPSGVKSIDATSYFKLSNGNDNTANSPSIQRYFRTSPNPPSSDEQKGYLPNRVYEMYINTQAEDPALEEDTVPGLFSGFYEDGYQKNGESAVVEAKKKGNDRIESITLTDVEYLPDYAFDSCERLKRVVLGSKLTDIGT
ncbi:MAG: leucine-rich repeat protein, partial [Clostridiales bacterium]|nr:leucine-rich repeat protein [Clostridiales bacterium]